MKRSVQPIPTRSGHPRMGVWIGAAVTGRGKPQAPQPEVIR